MTRAHQIEVWIGSISILALVGVGLLLLRWHTRQPVLLRGAVIVQDTDSRKEQPIADVQVTANLATGPATSDATGLFTLQLRRFVRRGEPLALTFRHPRYRPLDVKEFVGDKLYVVHMLPIASTPPSSTRPMVKVGNVRVRYSIR